MPTTEPPPVTNVRLFTGVQDEPVWPARPPLAKFGFWLRSLFNFTAGSKTPSNFNWDDQGVVPLPGNQASLAACICYASCLAAATSYRIKTGKVISVAPRVMHLCTMQLPPGSGTNSSHFEKSALAFGLPITRDASMAAQAIAISSEAQCTVFGGLSRLKVAAVHRFSTSLEVKDALCRTGPVVVFMDLYDDFSKHYVAETVYSPPAGATPTTSHAVCLIGYDDAKQCWIGVNSQGSGWGAQGRFRVKYGECDVLGPGAAAYALEIQA